jgi:hypothetical protein
MGRDKSGEKKREGGGMGRGGEEEREEGERGSCAHFFRR